MIPVLLTVLSLIMPLAVSEQALLSSPFAVDGDVPVMVTWALLV